MPDEHPPGRETPIVESPSGDDRYQRIAALTRRTLVGEDHPSDRPATANYVDEVATILVAATGSLVYENPALLSVLEEHLKDNDGEMLPYLVVADVVRWMAANQHVHADVCRSVFEWLERELQRGTKDVQELILFGVLEAMPAPHEAGSELRDLLPPGLRPHDPWSGESKRS